MGHIKQKTLAQQRGESACASAVPPDLPLGGRVVLSALCEGRIETTFRVSHRLITKPSVLHTG